ncbi:MAG: hypothetical protein WC159_12780 [Sphaerochaetaceae bacterium]
MRSKSETVVAIPPVVRLVIVGIQPLTIVITIGVEQVRIAISLARDISLITAL